MTEEQNNRIYESYVPYPVLRHFPNRKMENANKQKPFVFAGQCDDEVILTFDNTDKQLFVSRNFLSLVSPVFRTMFTSDFIEKSTGVVEMKDKEYVDFLELLLIIHPCVKKPITGKSFFRY